MNNLSFHITDITTNSIRAKANTIEINIRETESRIEIVITDNGSGMDSETLARVTDPFYTSRTKRKVGLGLPFLIQNAEQTGGKVAIRSTTGEGTQVTASFISAHIDCPPWGDLSGTIALLITGNPQVNIIFTYQSADVHFSISSLEIKETLQDIPLSHPQVTSWLKEMVEENIHIRTS